MLQIYSVSQAKDSILRRDYWLDTPLPEPVQAAVRRLFGADLTAEEVVQRILNDVRQRGDQALFDWSAKLDGASLAHLMVPESDLDAARQALPADLAEALQLAARRIRDFHERQPLPAWETTDLGGRLGQRATPLGRVGIYVPGGTAPLPSSLLMAAIPAQVAGVAEIVVATPPTGAGRVAEVILATARLLGLSTVYSLGGAQAIAALALGTGTIAPVDKIVGPGNLFVTLAKRQVYGRVGIDGLYGPTETVIIADETARAEWVAADLLAQAEHDALATAILLTPSAPLARAVQAAAARRFSSLSRAEVVAAALANRGGIVLTRDLAEAYALADAFAPEHLCLAVPGPADAARQIRSAGGLFLGERSFEVLGDYVAGPSHIMPTGGTARFASPLNVLDFLRLNSVIELDAATAARLSPFAARLANAEGLTAHAAAARLRVQPDDGSRPARLRPGLSGGEA